MKIQTTIKNYFCLACTAVVLFLAIGNTNTFADTTETQRLREFVRIHYHHGLPRGHAKSFGAAAIPELKKMLDDPAEKQAWPNIVYMLGILENDSATKPLIDFLEKRFTGQVDNTTYRALVAIPNSLGLIAKGHDNEAERYLIKGLKQKTWKKKKLKWSYPTLDKKEQRLLMMKLSVSGAGNSGSEKTRKALDQLKTSLEKKKSRSREKQLLLPSVQEAIKVNQLIKEKGRSALFNPEELKKILINNNNRTNLKTN